MISMLAQTPLHSWHLAHGGRMVDFAGWSMPVQYTGIVEEHRATRSAIGLFDISHMGRFGFWGADGGRLLDALLTRRASDMQCGQVRYSLMTDQAGGILDDVLVYRLVDTGGKQSHQLVVNASNRQKIWKWISAHYGSLDVEVVDLTLASAMIAVQGPRALEIVAPLSSVDPASLRYYHVADAFVDGRPMVLSRTGYTGEDGCELVMAEEVAVEIWEKLIAAAEARGGRAAGLGARDTLRLEAAMPLYGHELDESTDPFQAGLAFAVDLDGREFPGRDALVKLRDASDRPRRVGLQLAGRRPAREGYRVLANDRQVGRVTSGTFSPTLEKPIAMGYVEQEFSALGTRVVIDIRGALEPATVVELPFYRRPKPSKP